jgi:hypothetical protein
MIFHGRYRENYGAYRPFITAYVLSPDGKWIKYSGIDLSRLEVRDDVGGIGGYGIPYFRFNTQIKLISSKETKVFGGEVNIFLDPHASEVPLLGRDVLDNFAVICDRSKNYVILLDEPDIYRIERSG